ncbi:Ketoreductase CTB6-like protein [Cladobotryum mycophilum]|uniref:Ketoreductase CTB6-like protein n=1 Tax=Cladobotryum mycophilum TaxID=491253 RepID=A0ABR0SHL2_9HYPO
MDGFFHSRPGYNPAFEAQTILITEPTSLIGFPTLIKALEIGYHVRAVVCNESEILLTKLRLSYLNIGDQHKLEFVVASGAMDWDALLRSITAVIHFPPGIEGECDDYDAKITKPTISGVMGVLKAAARMHTVRRVVLCLSWITLMPYSYKENPNQPRIFTRNDINKKTKGPFKIAQQASWAASGIARQEVKDFIKNKDFDFDIINLITAIPIGADIRIPGYANVRHMLQGSARTILSPLLAKDDTQIQRCPGAAVHIKDVACALVEAANHIQMRGNTEYILSAKSSESIKWNTEILACAFRHFLEAIDDGRLPVQGALKTAKLRFDTEQTVRAFRWNLTSFDKAMKEMIAQYLELSANGPEAP